MEASYDYEEHKMFVDIRRKQNDLSRGFTEWDWCEKD